MNKLLLAALLAVPCATVAPQAQADPIGPKPGELVTVRGFQLSITANSQEYAVSTPITIDASIKNVTDKSLFLGMSSDPADYQIEVKTDGGLATDKSESVPFTRYGQGSQNDQGDFFNRGAQKFSAGQITSRKFIVNQIFDMTIPGRYIVKVTHHTKAIGDSLSMTSNILHITVR